MTNVQTSTPGSGLQYAPAPRAIATFHQSTAADRTIFTPTRPCKVVGASVVWGTAEVTAGSLNLLIARTASGGIDGSGAALANAISMKGTANTPVQATLQSGFVDLAVGQRVTVDYSAAGTELANIQVTLELELL